jgi:predicted RNA-binding protein with PUA-like domain
VVTGASFSARAASTSLPSARREGADGLLADEGGADDYDWDRLVADGETEWTGVRNYAAALHMRAMRLGRAGVPLPLVVEPAIVGVMTVAREAYPNPDEPDGKFCRVRVRPLAPVAREVSLRAIKADPRFADLALVRQSRLSVRRWAEASLGGGGMAASWRARRTSAAEKFRPCAPPHPVRGGGRHQPRLLFGRSRRDRRLP